MSSTLDKSLVKKIDELQEFSINTIKEMVSIPTPVPPGENYKEFVEYANSVLKDIGIKTEIIEVPKSILKQNIPEMADYPRYILIGRVKGNSENPVVHFNGHYDVVPPGEGWNVTAPFVPNIIENKIYGRGTADMKGGIVSAIAAIKALLELDIELNGSIEISMTPDEEIGGLCGAKYLIENKFVNPDYVIIPEPSGYDRIWIGHKGVLWGEITVYGKAAHASVPWNGINAFEKTVNLANVLFKELKPKVENKFTEYNVDVPEGKRATIVIGSIVRGGIKTNVVPDKVVFQFDRRILPEEKFDNVVAEVIEAIEKAKEQDPELKADFKTLLRADPAVTPPEAKIVCELKEAVKSLINKEPKLTLSTGFLDMRFFVKAGYQTVSYGPGEISQAHVANEYLEIDKMMLVSKVFGLFIKNVLKGGEKDE
ncbi:M20 family metallopeptidase [Thermococcus sibiricus]|uniref:Probable succinyl-diaminopimelate desuccinylase n=1 Tax=Thermococcus sibiricus TaxID=172049 RepID=A0A101EKB7_9EURY|nr:M20 family metallopeptidase [Thermococcus sibiricus]KUK16729.1 MAG: Acetylornithine deacetylase or succinyl-diaminopimelate desuccinylase [Thermococcus sibiricus]